MTQPSSSLFIHDVIDTRPLGRLQLSAIITCILIVVLDGFDTQTIGMLVPAMSKDLGIPIKAFGPIFSAGLVGMLLGAVVLGPLADRFGRKTMIVLSSLLFGSLSFATSYAGSFDQLLVLRFITGIGLGGALPNALSLAAEYAPKKFSRTIVATLMCGMPLGAVLGGMVSSILLPIHGWHSVFIVGGFLPVAVALFALGFMPESARFLVARGGNKTRLHAIMRRIAPDLPPKQTYHAPQQISNSVPIGELFSNGRWVDTILLWIPYFMNLVVLYFIVSWMPAVLIGSHHPISVGIQAITLFSLGGVAGCLAQGPLMNRFGARTVLLAQLTTYAALAIILANWSERYLVVVVISTLMGVVIQGAQAGFNVLATEIYPTHMRATGVGFAVGIGRIGSICGPLAGGLMLTLQLDVKYIFLAGIVPALIAATAIAWNRTVKR
ncbi:MFS transporter [Glaciimonas sp. PAMC28666]|uniref:MFS transporter n=1 Tax=Glaciimonas sp. PAMC28666 TaxID=2807626 RepID=UPI001966271A|nr:MFS transporter [Glaciimonas sp. PAMC28666]QRX81812.1 MFS transporter [Glaciimonas sp. PAMC28666]